jgi:glycosyltransferase involved in cell wall biosynthesis
MKTLFLCTSLPYPLDVGSRQRTFHLLKGLARVSDVTLVALGEVDELERAAPVRELCREVELIPRRSAEWTRGAERSRASNWLREGLFLLHPSRPSSLSWSRIDGARARAAARIGGGFDFILAYRLGWMEALPKATATRVLVDLDDVEHRKLGTKLRRVGVSRHAPLEAIDYLKFRRLERNLWRTGFDFAVCSEAEARALPARTRVQIIPNGVNLPAALAPTGAGTNTSSNTILFVGTMNYAPNSDAVVFFAREVLPLLRRERPDARFEIVGHAPPPAVRRLGELPGVRVIGSVPDLVPVLSAATVVVAPLRYGGGTRIKVLEALAHEKPLVATSFAIDGLDLEPGRHLLVGDDPGGLAASCRRLLGDPDLRARLAKEGRRVIEGKYQWKRIEDRVAEIATGGASSLER